MNHLLALDNRRRILQTVNNQPGIHFREISRILGMGIGTLDYHLRLLEDHGLVLRRSTSRENHYFPIGTSINHQDLSILLRQHKPRLIISTLALHEPGLNHHSLCSITGIAPSTMTWNLQKLTRAGLITKGRTNGKEHYTLIAIDDIMTFLNSTPQNTTDKLIDRFIDVWEQ